MLNNLYALLFGSTILWLISLVRRDASIVDIFWGLGFVLVTWLSFAWVGVQFLQSPLLPVLVSIWGLRLSGYLALRNWGKPEDFRYREMRNHHGKWFSMVSLFTVFGLQAVLVWIISLPIQVAFFSETAALFPSWLGIAVWLAGLVCETVGDLQMARFKADPANKGLVMNQGLWRYTRHPNYFGDFLVWWGHYWLLPKRVRGGGR